MFTLILAFFKGRNPIPVDEVLNNQEFIEDGGKNHDSARKLTSSDGGRAVTISYNAIDDSMTIENDSFSNHSDQNDIPFKNGCSKIQLKILNFDQSIVRNSRLNIRGKVTFADGLERPLYFHFNIDEKELEINGYLYDSKYNEFNLTIGNFGHLQIGKQYHQIQLYAITDDGCQSEIWNSSIEYKFNPPQLHIDSIYQYQFTKNRDIAIPIHLIVNDTDGVGIIGLYYRFDDRTEEPLRMDNIHDFELISFNFDIPFPSDLKEGNHDISIYVVDKDAIKSNVGIFTFMYNFEPPLLEISYNQKYVYFKNRDEEITINCRIIDPNNSAYLILSYSIDEVMYPQQNISLNSRKTFIHYSFVIQLDQNMDEGTHFIKLWVTGNSKRSHEYVIEFKFNKRTSTEAIYHNGYDHRILLAGKNI